MGISKVDYNGINLIDLSNDTVTPETLAEGMTAHNANGDPITGTMTKTGGEAVQEVMWVTGKLVLSTTISVIDLSHTYEQIKDALDANKVVRMRLRNDNTGKYYFAEVSNYTTIRSVVQFVSNIKENFGYGELPYLIFISLYTTGTTSISVNVVNTTSA